MYIATPNNTLQRFSRYKAADVVTVLALLSLAFPMLFRFEFAGRFLYPHYLTLMVAIPVLFALRPFQVKMTLLTVGMIVLSTVFHPNTASLPIATFHLSHILAIALLGGTPLPLALKLAKIILTVYVVTILTIWVLVTIGFGVLVEGFFLTARGAVSTTRIAGFATEPSYAGLIILIAGRFVILFDPAWMTLRRLALASLALVATASMFSMISISFLLIIYLREIKNAKALIYMFAGFALLAGAMVYVDFFASRVSRLDFSAGVLGLDTGTVRLLPYIYMANILPENPWPLFWGAGAGVLEPSFFANLGQFSTNNDYLSTQMAGAIYDYGLLAVAPFLFFWNRPAGFIDRTIFMVMAVLIMLNTGIGTYLFVLFGTYALIEQKARNHA